MEAGEDSGIGGCGSWPGAVSSEGAAGRIFEGDSYLKALNLYNYALF